MQKTSSPIGQCSKGHDVYVTRDLNGDVNGGTIGADIVMPLPDGRSSLPIAVACQACVDLVNHHIRQRP